MDEYELDSIPDPLEYKVWEERPHFPRTGREFALIRELNYVRICLGICVMVSVWLGYASHKEAHRLDALEQLVQEVESAEENTPAYSDVNEAYRRCRVLDEKVDALTLRYQDHLAGSHAEVIMLKEGPATQPSPAPTPAPRTTPALLYSDGASMQWIPLSSGSLSVSN